MPWKFDLTHEAESPKDSTSGKKRNSSKMDLVGFENKLLISKTYFTTTARIKTIVESLVEDARRGGIPRAFVTT